MNNILASGGGGFIGSHVAETLGKQGHQVTVLDDLSGGFRDNVMDGIEFVHGSINDIGLVNSLFEQRHFEYVYHLAAYAAEGMTIFGEGTQTRAFGYIHDIVPIMVEAIHQPAAYNQVFNIGADQPYSVMDLAHAVARAMGVKPDIQHVPPRNEVVNAYSSHDKVRRVFGERKSHSLDEGLHIMAEWVKQHGARTSKKSEGIEVAKNLPRAWQD